MVCATSKGSDQPAHGRSLIRAFASRLNKLTVKLLSEYKLEVLSLKGDCSASSESTLVKMSHYWKSSVTAHFFLFMIFMLLYFLFVCVDVCVCCVALVNNFFSVMSG